MDKDMVNVGIRRQSCSPPNIAMSSLIQRGSSQVRQPSLRCSFLLVSIGSIGGSQARPQPLQYCLGFNCPITSCRVVESRITSCRVVVTSCRVVVTSGHVLLISGCRI